jgi:succinate dehydrogenase/fumarate reductase cytochrome b subunit
MRGDRYEAQSQEQQAFHGNAVRNPHPFSLKVFPFAILAYVAHKFSGVRILFNAVALIPKIRIRELLQPVSLPGFVCPSGEVHL